MGGHLNNGVNDAKDIAWAESDVLHPQNGGWAGDAAGKAAAAPQQRSIYSLYKRRYLMVILVSLSNFMVPFADIVFLPTIVTISKQFRTDMSHVAATLAAPMFTSGVASLLWGPACDFLGRRPTFLASVLCLLGFTIGSAFAPNIIALIVFRGLAGIATSGMLVSTNAVLADVYEPWQRGKWMGIASCPALIAPIIGPPIGGALALRLGWRATFMAAAIVCLVVLVYAALVLKETHQYKTLQRVRKEEGDASAESIEEAVLWANGPPRLVGPWRPIGYLFEASIAPYALIAIIAQAAMVSGVIALPGALAYPPYSLNEAMIGAATIPIGVGSLLSSPFGGMLADFAAKRVPKPASARMLPGVLSTLIIFPTFLIVYGWMLHIGGPLAAVLATSAFLGVAMCLYMPALFSYITILKQANAGSAGAVIQSATHIMQGIFTQVTPIALMSMGMGPYLSLAGGLVFLASLIALALVLHGIASARRARPACAGADAA